LHARAVPVSIDTAKVRDICALGRRNLDRRALYNTRARLQIAKRARGPSAAGDRIFYGEGLEGREEEPVLHYARFPYIREAIHLGRAMSPGEFHLPRVKE